MKIKLEKRMGRSPLSVAVITALAAVIVAGCLAHAKPPLSFDPVRVTWSKLEYQASKLGFSTTSSISLESFTADQAEGHFISAGDYTGLAPREPKLLRLRILSSLLGRDTRSDLCFGPVKAEAYQAIQHTTGKRFRYRGYRFAEEGVFSVVRKPEPGQEGLPPDHWSNAYDEAFPYPDWAGKQLVVASPSALFYILSVADLSRVGDHLELPVFSRTDVSLMKIRVERAERIKVDYTIEGGGAGKRRIRDRVDTLRLFLSAQPFDERSASDFQLIGLHGDVEIHLDPRYRVPLEIEGSVPRAGKVRIRLKHLELK
jgi:hypothetical protein